jgi:Na+-driven multidrug efflux pump
MKLIAKVILPCLGLGISTFVMVSTESILSISFTRNFKGYGGDLAVGAMTIITSVSQLVTMPLSGICQGAQPIVSFNYGAGNNDRVKKAFRLELIICASYATIFWAMLMVCPTVFASIFNNDPALVSYTGWAMRVYMAGIFAMGLQLVCQPSFMALGQAKVSLLLACLRKIILLIPLIFILPQLFENKVFAVFLAEPVSDIVAATVTVTVFALQFKKILEKGPTKK